MPSFIESKCCSNTFFAAANRAESKAFINPETASLVFVLISPCAFDIGAACQTHSTHIAAITDFKVLPIIFLDYRITLCLFEIFVKKKVYFFFVEMKFLHIRLNLFLNYRILKFPY